MAKKEFPSHQKNRLIVDYGTLLFLAVLMAVAMNGKGIADNMVIAMEELSTMRAELLRSIDGW